MELHEIERDIEALKSSPLVLVCRTPQGRVKAMSLQLSLIHISEPTRQLE